MKNINLCIVFFLIVAILIFSGCDNSKIKAVKIQIDNSNISADKADGLDIVGRNIVITKGGSYLLSGYGTEVQITIYSEDPVELILDDLQLYNESYSVINVISEAKVSIVSTGTEGNVLSIGSGKLTGCIESDGPLYFYGDTQIKVQGIMCIKSNEKIILDGQLSLYSMVDAVSADSISIIGGNISIVTGQDGFNADKIEIEQGSISITGNGEKSRKIYSKGDILISGGDIHLSTTDDGLSAKGDFVLTDGSLIIESEDDAIHAGENAKISGGSIDIQKCLEGIESSHIEISGGSISMVSENDGLNAAFDDKDNKGSADINISGGEISINASGDGLDANGSIFVSGGVLFVSGANGGKNNAIDFDIDFVIDGGTIIAAGNNLGAKPPSVNSLQNSIVVSFDSTHSETFVLNDKEGAAILAANFPKPYDCVIISLGSLIESNTYYYGIAEIESLNSAYSLDLENSGVFLSKLGEFTVSESVTLVHSK
ncbi:MAG: carbohydrate-binding domain-containing protein [Clostridia bacterium]|nr:carbohydrate-binding domain-containing protein [Clostridia bacterium]